MTKAAIYARVSTDAQAERATIETQIEAASRFIEKQGWDLAKVVRDDGISGAVPFAERPGGGALLALAEQGEIDRVVIYSVDRLARNSEDISAHNRMHRALAPASVRRGRKQASAWDGSGEQHVLYVTQSFDGTPAGEMMLTIFLAIAKFERSQIAQRTSSGRMRRVQQGKYQAPVTPYGYTYNRETGQLELNPETAPIVVEIFDLALAGWGSKAIADELNERNIRTPLSAFPARHHPHKKPDTFGWNWGTVAKLLKAQRYAGQASYGGQEMRCPAIISQSTFDRVQQGLAKRKSEAKRSTKQAYLLQHLVWCRHCGSRYTAMTRKGGKQAYACHMRRVYSKSDNGLHNAVARWWWPADLLEWPIKQAVNAITTEPAAYLDSHHARIEDLRQGLSVSDEQVAKLEQTLAGVDVRQKRLVDAFARGLLDEQDLSSQMGEIKREREALTEQLREKRATAANAESLAAILDSWSAQIARDIGDGKAHGALIWAPEYRYSEEAREEVLSSEVPFDVWHRVIREVVTKIWVEDDGSLTLEGPGEAVIIRDSSGSVSNSMQPR